MKECNPHLVGGSSDQDSFFLPRDHGKRGLNVAVSGDWAGGARNAVVQTLLK